MAINPDKCIKVTGRFHSTQGTVGEPALTNVVAGADEVYDDTVPYRYNGHIDCKEVTPIGTENPQELEWFEKVYNTLEPTLFEWVKTADTSVDSEKTYGISIGAKQSDVNKQLYNRLDDIYEVTINADDVSKVITSDANKIINKEDGYVPTAAAIGEALGANFEDSLTSTSTVKGLTANMGRELNEIKANKNGWYEQLVSGASLSLIGDDIDHKATFLERETGDSTATGGINHSVDKGTATIETIYGHTEKFNQLVQNGDFSDGTDGWSRISSVTDNIATNDFTTAYVSVERINNNIDIQLGHKYFIVLRYKGDANTSTTGWRIAIGNIDNSDFVDATLNLPTTTFQTFTALLQFKSSIVGPANKIKNIRLYNTYGNAGNLWFTDIQVIDLTAIFGAGNEPSTVEEFEAWLANNIGIQDYYDYTPGTLISLNPDSLVSTGFNQWDEKWEVGAIDPNTGDNAQGFIIRSKNYIRVIPGAEYFYKCPHSSNWIIYYDNNKNFVGNDGSYHVNTTFIVPTNAYYMRFTQGVNYGTTYNHDICINLSDPAKNGTYMPYMKPSTVDLSWIKDIPDPNDNTKKLFPYGLLSAGSVHDEVYTDKVIKKVERVNLGDLTYRQSSTSVSGKYRWTADLQGIVKPNSGNIPFNGICTKYPAIGSAYTYAAQEGICAETAFEGVTIFDEIFVTSDATTFKNAMLNQHVILYYELAIPITIYFDEHNTHPMNYEVEDGGREKMLPENTSTPTTTSLVADIRYPLNALEAIRNLQNNFSTQGALYQTFNSLCSALNSAITTGTFAVAPDETVVGKFNFTFTPTKNTQSVESNETI